MCFVHGVLARCSDRISRTEDEPSLRVMEISRKARPWRGHPTRAALAAVLHRAKRNKAFEDCRFVGLALDGTTGGRRRKWGCPLCRPYRNADQEILGYRHHLVLAAVVGGDLTLPVDVEHYGPGDSEYAAGQRLLRRVRVNLGARFIDYVVVDGGFATAPFLHVAGKAGWPVVARLKENLPELSQAAERRFRSRSPDLEFRDGTDQRPNLGRR